MASNTYNDMMKIIYDYVPKEKADEVVGRQMSKSEQTIDTLDINGYKKIMMALSCSVTLYVADSGKRAELVDKIKAMGQ
jgi:hypothetical protein